MNGGSEEVGSEVLVMCGSFGLSVMTMRVGQRAYEIAQDIEGVGAQERQITTLTTMCMAVSKPKYVNTWEFLNCSWQFPTPPM